LLEITKAGAGTAGIYIYILGFVSSFITGYIALRFLLVFIKKGKLHYFGFYVIIMGIISIVLHWRGT
jgi:undecaprenyl-diphosphatase